MLCIADRAYRSAEAENLNYRMGLIKAALRGKKFWRKVDSTLLQGEPVPLSYRGIKGNVNPFDFVRQLDGSFDVSAFSRIPSSAEFNRPGLPAWSSEPGTSRFVGELAARMGAKTVIEIGSFVGYTSAHLAAALQTTGGRLWCVDIAQNLIDVARENLSRLKMNDRVSFVCGLSQDPATFAALPEKADLIFIDSSHIYADTQQEISIFRKRIAPGGALVLHDSIYFEGVRRAVGEVQTEFETLTFASEGGWGVSVLRPRAAA